MRYRGLSFSMHLTKEIMERVIKSTPMRKKARVLDSSDQFIIYQYEGKCPTILDLLNQQIFTTQDAFDRFQRRHCQQQASIIMRMLKEHGYASFGRVSVTVNLYRIGETKEDREITYNAWEDLLK